MAGQMRDSGNVKASRGGTSAYRLAVLSRIGAAAFSGYAFAAALSILLSRVLPMPKAEAVLTATMLSFALYAGAIVWAFAVRTATRAWVGLAVPAAACAAVSWLLGAGAVL